MTVQLPGQRSNKPADCDRSAPPLSIFDQILRSNGGAGLWNLSRELASLILRRYYVEKNFPVLKLKLKASLKNILGCNSIQAESVIDLSVELIHLRYFGHYQRSNVEISYLIAKATGAAQETKEN